MVLKFDWSHYIGVQLDWADAVKTRADEIHGYEPEFLHAKHVEILADLNGRFRRELADIVLLRRLDRRQYVRKRTRRPAQSAALPRRKAV